jgi:hypothetical protein
MLRLSRFPLSAGKAPASSGCSGELAKSSVDSASPVLVTGGGQGIRYGFDVGETQNAVLLCVEVMRGPRRSVGEQRICSQNGPDENPALVLCAPGKAH